MKNIFTVDVEDFNHRLAYTKDCEERNLNYPQSSFEGVKKVIKILNAFSYTATFFIIGEIVERNPSIAEYIISNGHEIANHTYRHSELTSFNSPEDVKSDILKFDNLIKDVVGIKPVGFRAPKWSVKPEMNWLFEILRECNYDYDASIFPSNGYGYGISNSYIYPYEIDKINFLEKGKSSFFEFPTIIYPFSNFRVPIKLRHFGTKVMAQAIKSYNSKMQPATVLLHSWELIPPPSDFLSQNNLIKNFIRNYRIPCDSQLIKLFKKYEFLSIKDYMQEMK